MSLLINADAEYYSGTGGSFGSNLTQCTFAIWIKRDSGTSGTQAYAHISPLLTSVTNMLLLAHNGGNADVWVYPSNSQHRIADGVAANTTTWQLLVITYEQSVEYKLWIGVGSGGALSSVADSAPAESFNDAIDSISIGSAQNGVHDTWHARCRLAHCAFWDAKLSSAQVAELHNGGVAGAGKNPTAVATSNLKFYAPLTSDATVHTGGITLSATGSPTFDAVENPAVDAVGGAASTSQQWRRVFPYSVLNH
jgi:hypothetical protein